MKSQLNQARLLLLVALCALMLLVGEAKQEDAKTDGKEKTHEFDEQNEIDDRIVVGEPYKSLLKTTTRFALAQTKISNHLNLDVAMDLLSDAGFMLSRTSTLIKLVKIVAVTIASLLATTLILPGTYKFVDAAWRNPSATLNFDRYLSNGVSEKSVLSVLGSKTDETLKRIGLQDYACREQSLCYIGEILKCSFPQTSEGIIKFASENFSNTGIKDNIYARAFVSGFVDRNCSRVATSSETSNCLGNLFNSILVAPKSRAKRSKMNS